MALRLEDLADLPVQTIVADRSSLQLIFRKTGAGKTSWETLIPGPGSQFRVSDRTPPGARSFVALTSALARGEKLYVLK